jgi:hypothetical protein
MSRKLQERPYFPDWMETSFTEAHLDIVGDILDDFVLIFVKRTLKMIVDFLPTSILLIMDGYRIDQRYIPELIRQKMFDIGFTLFRDFLDGYILGGIDGCLPLAYCFILARLRSAIERPNEKNSAVTSVAVRKHRNDFIMHPPTVYK